MYSLEKNVQLTVNIDPEARQLLERAAQRIVHDEGDQLPLGRVITALIFHAEDNGIWKEIREEIHADFARENHERKKRDRERKRL
jgi:hypothetical protein